MSSRSKVYSMPSLSCHTFLGAQGLTNGQIGSRLNLSLATVKAHLSSIFTKLQVDNRVSAAMTIRDALI